jgi:branched-chain amino acid transport system substrate-binding protein
MKRSDFFKITVGILAVAMLASLECGCNQHQNKTPSEIKIAVPVPLTGKYREFGLDLVNAAQMAVDEANAQGGLGGKSLVIVTEDDKGDPKDAVTVAQRIVDDQSIIGVMGHLNSGTTLAASPVYAEAGIAVLMPVPTNPEITKQGFTNFFRVPITDDKQGSAAYEFLAKKAQKSALAVIHNRETYGKGIAEEFVKSLEADGAKPLLFEGVNANEQDYRPTIGKIKAANASGIFFGGEYADAARFIRQAREQGVEAPIVMGDGCFNTEMATIAGDAVRNCYVANIAPLNAPNERARRFYDGFAQKHGKIVAYAPLGYVATQILIDAIRKAPEPSRKAVLAVLRDKSYTYDSILGEFKFTPNGDSVGRKIFWHEFKNGQFSAITE